MTVDTGAAGAADILVLNILAEASGDGIAQAFSQQAGYKVIKHATLDSLIAGIDANPEAVVIFEAAGSVDIITALARIGDRSVDTPGVILGDNLPMSAVRSLLLLRRWDLLDLPTSFELLSEAVRRVSQSPASAPQVAAPVKQGKCWAFTSPVGGGGSTLLAVETAFQLSQGTAKPRTCLIDMNFFDGSCAQFLNSDPNLSLSALATTPERIDAVLLQALTTTHRSGLELLAAPRTVDTSLFPSREVTLRCLEVACEIYDHVIVDIPRWPMPWTKDVVEGADETLLVSELTVPALNAARDWIIDFDKDALPGISRIKTILNRRQKSLFGGNLTVEQAEKAIQQRVFASVHSDWSASMSAVNLGQPVSIAKPGSVIVKDIAAVIGELNKTNQTRAASPKSKKVA